MIQKTKVKAIAQAISEAFDFHYVYTATGEISGPSVLKQTEDAINDVGKYAKGAYDMSSSSDQKAQQAVEIAQNAQSTANNALAGASSAVEKVDTLSTVVNGYDAKINEAVTKSDAAVSTSNEANSKSDDAVAKAEQAKTDAENARDEAEQSKVSAENAQNEAQTAKEAAENAKLSAENAQNSAQDAEIRAQNLSETSLKAVEVAQQAIEQAYAVRTSSTALVSNGSVTVADLSPIENIKVGDTVIDVNGQVFQIVEIQETTSESGETIKTAVLSEVKTDLSPYVTGKFSQTFTDAEKTQARQNIGAADDADVVKLSAQTLTEAQMDQVAKNIGLIDALKELIEEYGGTVPTE